MKLPRQCCRPGCARPAVATLTFVYAESTAVIGPLASSDEPHSWDLCDDHARRITVPRGWEMLRSERGFSVPVAEDYELTALAEAVREVSGGTHVPSGEHWADAFDGLEDTPAGRQRGGRVAGQSGEPRRSADEAPRFTPRAGSAGQQSGARTPGQRSATPRPGRRGHLRVLPDPID